MIYPHLGLRDWPFRIVPELQFCDFIADRGTLRKDVEDLLGSLENRPTSDIQLIWSWYGAGKTHTLYYIVNQCRNKHRRLMPIYTELPREAKSFVDLYRMSVSQISVERMIDVFLEISTGSCTEPLFGGAADPDLSTALTQAAVSERRTRGTLEQWLRGNSLPQAALRELGVGARLNTTEKCADILAQIVSLITSPNVPLVREQVFRIIWIIDEVQRVEDLPRAGKRSMLSGMVGVFNRCPIGLTLLMSYTGAPNEKSLPAWINEAPDLKDRIGLERPMLLPPLRSDEAVLLVRELLAHFRLPDAVDRGAFYPFEESAIDALLKALGRKGELKPRSIMETLDASLRLLEPRIRSGAISTIGLKDLKESLERFPLDWSEPSSRPARERHT